MFETPEELLTLGSAALKDALGKLGLKQASLDRALRTRHKLLSVHDSAFWNGRLVAAR